LWSNIHDDLYEHIDGLHSVVPNPHKHRNQAQENNTVKKGGVNVIADQS